MTPLSEPEKSEPIVGPDSEQLDLAEDSNRLADIGDLVRAGHARLEDFDLTKWELVFLNGYLNGAE